MGRISRKNNRSKYFSLMLLILALVMTGCGNQSADKGSAGSASVTAKSQAKAQSTDTDTVRKEETSGETRAEIPEELLPSASGTGADAAGDSRSTSSGDATDTSDNAVFDAGGGSSSHSTGNSSGTDSGGGSGSSTGNGSSANDSSSNQGTIQVTMSIDGSAANSYGYGVSMDAVAITLKAGSSVYDALVSSGVSFSGNSGYVSGIGGLYEKDCGSQSGWKYYVNGVTPNKGCGNYQCSNGDSIVWTYVLAP
ncbi:MAG: DUF4430 domain-containing protein [Hespellia sp.]|nr:DUF4430 domain-containing protein [Hespellia sp.]